MTKSKLKLIAKKTTTKKAVPKRVVKHGIVAKGRNKVFRSDVKQAATLVKVGRLGSANAIRALKALDLPITYMQNGVLYRELSNGTKEKIVTVSSKKQGSKKTALPLKKGMVLHATK
jgi:hypothetical protein